MEHVQLATDSLDDESRGTRCFLFSPGDSSNYARSWMLAWKVTLGNTDKIERAWEKKISSCARVCVVCVVCDLAVIFPGARVTG